MGPNGAGKTTLISILCGLLSRTEGEVTILGLDIDDHLPAIRDRINLVLGFTGISMDITVKEFLKYYCYLYSLDKTEARIQQVMEAVSITDKAKTLTRDLSSGYKQRLLLAKALLNKPDIIFLDEPTVGLDVDIAIKIRGLIRDLRKQGTTILLTTHNMYEVEELCDRIALISKGKIIATGTVADIKKMIQVDKVIEVEVDNLEGFAQEISKKKYVLATRIVDDAVLVTVENYGSIRKVMEHLAKSKHHIYLVRLVEPSLEEAFLTLTRASHA